MRIKKLKEKIKDLPDNMRVVLEGSDHSYYNAGRGDKVEAVESNCHLSEHFEGIELDPGEEKVEVFLIV